MKRVKMTRVVGGLRYDTEKATLLAHDVYWANDSWERGGHNRWLYRTPRGRYFVVTGTLWAGERDNLEPVPLEEAMRLYEGPLTEHEVPYEEAFPAVVVEKA